MANFNLAAAMAAVQKQRDAQPLRYAPGNLTLDARKAMEQKRQFNEELAEKAREADMDAQLKAAQIAAAGRSSGNSGGNLSQWQQKIVGQNLANNAAVAKYQENLSKYKDGSNVDPLHWAIREVLTGQTANGQSSGLSQSILDSSGDPTKAVDALLGSLGTDAENYFTGNNKGLGDIYKASKNKLSTTDVMDQMLGDYLRSQMGQ